MNRSTRIYVSIASAISENGKPGRLAELAVAKGGNGILSRHRLRTYKTQLKKHSTSTVGSLLSYKYGVVQKYLTSSKKKKKNCKHKPEAIEANSFVQNVLEHRKFIWPTW